jgi:hypothetical protein
LAYLLCSRADERHGTGQVIGGLAQVALVYGLGHLAELVPGSARFGDQPLDDALQSSLCLLTTRGYLLRRAVPIRGAQDVEDRWASQSFPESVRRLFDGRGFR